MKEKIIYMPQVARQLREMGFKLLRTEIHPRKPQYDVYVFEETAELLRALTAITQSSK